VGVELQRLEISVHSGTPQHVPTAQTEPAGHVLPTPVQPVPPQLKSSPQKPPPVESVQQKQLLPLHGMKVAHVAPAQPGLGFDTPCAETGVTAPTIIGAT
jgi:hypothetical protein